MSRPSDVGPEGPSPRLVGQRVRNQVIRYLALAASFEEQREYERTAPIAYIPSEVINQWQDWVPEDPGQDQDLPDVYDSAEVEAMRQFHAAWDSAASAVPDDYPALSEVQDLPEWERLRGAAESALAVFSRRGTLPDDHEVED